MEIILMRHGPAIEREDWEKTGKDDSLRPLSLKGRKKTQKITEVLQAHVVSADVLISSPLVRARQTAEIVSKVFGDMEIVESAELFPEAHPQIFFRWLKSRNLNSSRVLIVGHEPQLSSFASYLLTGKEASFIQLKKGGMIFLQTPHGVVIEPEMAELVSIWQPRVMIG